MPNPYFKFKQFTVQHDLCAMKVNTDGVLLGAWASAHNPQLILDIGTGSGLVSLMLAQRYPAGCLLGIDIDQGACAQSKINFAQSPWAERMYVEHVSLQEFALSTHRKFDLIVSNPPFFNNSLKNPSKERTLARHTDSLSHKELFSCAKKLLTHTGTFCVVLPSESYVDVVEIAISLGFFHVATCFVHPTLQHDAKRVLLQFDAQKSDFNTSKLVIETTQRHCYTDEFKVLTKDFYL